MHPTYHRNTHAHAKESQVSNKQMINSDSTPGYPKRWCLKGENDKREQQLGNSSPAENTLEYDSDVVIPPDERILLWKATMQK